MQNNTSKMVALLGKIRKQMNGAVLDTFRYYGAKYGMNYGVALHSLRDMAREIGCDDELAHFLFRQQVRELQIIALWIADAEAVTEKEFDFWANGLINSELAEQAAQGLLSKITPIDTLVERWCGSGNELLAYAALLAASRSDKISINILQSSVNKVVTAFADNHLATQGVVALLGNKIENHRAVVESVLATLPDNRSAAVVREEIAWRLEY
ncbi:MAG: DNA alkylation repair protein [Alistipes sp.]|nr:DNA alkylation repair protein [Alistipes sp.]